MSPGHKRQIVESLVIAGRCSGRAACRHFGLHRSTFSYKAKEPDAWLARLKAALRRLSNQHAELGYAKITCFLKEDCRRRPRTAIMCGRGILCTTPRFEEARCACSMSWMNILASACASMWSGASMPVRCARSWHASLKSMEPRNTSAVTTAASSSNVDCVNGWPRTRSGPSTSRREARGRMATSRASMHVYAKNA